jgi:hypothetical protein
MQGRIPYSPISKKEILYLIYLIIIQKEEYDEKDIPDAIIHVGSAFDTRIIIWL